LDISGFERREKRCWVGVMDLLLGFDGKLGLSISFEYSERIKVDIGGTIVKNDFGVTSNWNG
jgi:hypothetical protein